MTTENSGQTEEVMETTLYGFKFREVDNRRTGRESCHDIKQLWQRSHEIIGLALQGMKQTEIAEILNITPATVSNTLNSQLGKEKLSEMREGRDDHYKQVNARVRALTMKALDTYKQIFESPNVDIGMKKETADTITLDIAGMRAPTKVDSRSLHAYATAEEILEFKRRGVAAAKESGMLIELEDEE